MKRKKLYKQDGAIYSYMSMNVSGGGRLNLTAENEGLGTELHLTINGGKVVALGSTMDWAESNSEQVAMNLQFSKMQSREDAIVIKDKSGKNIFEYTTIKSDRGYRGAVISVPDFKGNKEYSLYIAEKQQGYYGLDLAKGHRPPMPPDGKTGDFSDEFPHDRPKGEIPRSPEGFAEKNLRGNFSPVRGKQNFAGKEQKTAFVMSDKANLFTGVSEVK